MAFKSNWKLSFKGPLDVVVSTVALALCLGIFVSVDAGDTLPKSLDPDNSQIDFDAYNTNRHGFEKKGWSSLHPAWGKRDSEEDVDTQAMDKRAWQQLQAGWGKRFSPSDNDLMWRQLAAMLDDEGSDTNQDDQFDSHEIDKRTWRSFNQGWGKRSTKWDKFRGSWGKRQPAWNNLKGLWGKRSLAD